MDEIYKIFFNSVKFKEFYNYITRISDKLFIKNLAGAKSILAIGLYRVFNNNLIIITKNPYENNIFYEELKEFLSESQIFTLNSQEKNPLINSSCNFNSPLIFLLEKESLKDKIINPNLYRKSLFKLFCGQEIKKEVLIDYLLQTNYQFVDLVSEPGEVATRGNIVDFFSPNENRPLRIEFSGNRICSIRYFDVITQRTIEKTSEVQLFLNTQSEFSYTTVEEILPQEAIFITTLSLEEVAHIFSKTDLQKRKFIFLDAKEPIEGHIFDFEFREPILYWGNIKLLKNEIENSSEHYFIVVENTLRYDRLNYLLGPKPQYIIGTLYKGLEIPQEKIIVLTPTEIFGQPKMKLRHNKFHGQPIDDFLGIKKGDYVVHVDYGIGQFEGIRTIKVQEMKKDFIVILYQGNQRLYIPVENLNLIERYIGPDDNPPSLSKLGSQQWLITKARVKKSQEEFLKELLTLYAKRTLVRKIPLPKDDEWQFFVQASFPYEETKDQLRAFQEVNEDLERPMPMERLICGDNGFGKTEIALRAAVKAVSGLKQVAVLVPSTILCYQHYNNFKRRLEHLPIRVEMLSRLTSKKRIKEILKELKNGQVDIVIGTHLLLSPEVQFRDLGLLIIDEEHKFGVRQKERIKELKTDVDVLLLSATPIPRSLYRALIGIANISIVNTPPIGRRDIVTEVIFWDDEFISQKINFELTRGGQVLFIHNEIKTITQIKERLLKINSDWRIAIAHSKLSEKELTQVYLDFVNRKYDILVSTAIVEAGLDIPNVNTIFVNRAETFGLAQLHQLRGRVGRSFLQGYAYFIVSQNKALNEQNEAKYRQRLSALIAYSTLGSGFRLALRDLEIRGVGNLLGPEQHGHIRAVGFTLYRQLLETTIAQLKNQPVKQEPVLQIDLPASLPEEYISDSFERMAIYKRLLSLETEAELKNFKVELVDRFGTIPHEMNNLFTIAEIRLKAKEKGIQKVSFKKNQIEIELQNEKRKFSGDINTLLAVLENLTPTPVS
jgi:transcription-repair coupling factor (superfamily II helicase)